MEAPWNQEGSPFILTLLPTEPNSGQEQRRNAHWPSSVIAELAMGDRCWVTEAAHSQLALES